MYIYIMNYNKKYLNILKNNYNKNYNNPISKTI